MPSLRSSRVVLPDGLRPATVRYEAGVIVSISDGPADHDFGDLVVMPGLVDSHVHVNEPGRTDWEGFESATRAAIAGGTTTIVDMPLNSIPPTIDLEALAAKVEAARGTISSDVAFWGGIVPGSEKYVPVLAHAGVCGFKVFLVDSGVPEFPPMTIEELERVAWSLAELRLPLLVHAEEASALRPFFGDSRDYSAYLESRPPRSEQRAVSQVCGLANDTGARIHVLHVSSADAVQVLGAAGGKVSAETCPHYLTFSAEDIPAGATAYKCAPPIREVEHREGLWEGLRNGEISMVVSDHSPAPPYVKELETGDFARAWGGIASLQLRLPVTWTGARTRGFGLEDLVRWLCNAPARLAGLTERKGSIVVGGDADFVVFDPDGVTRVAGSRLEHRHPLTPYEGLTLAGEVVTTILRGVAVFERSRGIVPQTGRMLRHDD